MQAILLPGLRRPGKRSAPIEGMWSCKMFDNVELKMFENMKLNKNPFNLILVLPAVQGVIAAKPEIMCAPDALQNGSDFLREPSWHPACSSKLFLIIIFTCGS